MHRAHVVVLTLLLVGCGGQQSRQEAIDQLAPSLSFYASYEDGMDAAYARDDRRIYSAPSYDALSEGVTTEDLRPGMLDAVAKPTSGILRDDPTIRVA